MEHSTKMALVVGILGIAICSVSLGAKLEVPGLGMVSCGEVVELGSDVGRDRLERRDLESWGQGYMSGLMTAHAMQFAGSSEDVMGTGIAIEYDSSGDWEKFVAYCQESTGDNYAQAVMAEAIDLGVLQDQDPSVPGVYLLFEANGAQLPAISEKTNSNGEHCKNEILEGALILDAEGRSAAFLTERDTCQHDDESESAVKENSVIFPGTYVVSGNKIRIEDDFGTDQAVLNGDILTYRTGGEGAPSIELAFRRK